MHIYVLYQNSRGERPMFSPDKIADANVVKAFENALALLK